MRRPEHLNDRHVAAKEAVDLARFLQIHVGLTAGDDRRSQAFATLDISLKFRAIPTYEKFLPAALSIAAKQTRSTWVDVQL